MFDPNSAVIGGFMLVIVVVIFALIACLIAWVIVKGMGKIERFDRNRAIERNLREDLADAAAQQKAARKILAEYEGK